MKIVLVWGAIANYHRLNSLRQHAFISLSFGAWKSQTRVSGWLGSWWRPSCWLTVGPLSPRWCPHRAERVLAGSLAFAYQRTSPVKVPLSWPNYLTKSPSANTTMSALEFQQTNFGKTQALSTQWAFKTHVSLTLLLKLLIWQTKRCWACMSPLV